ncbi:hypothetical protein BHM03_00021979 [Ensete ventricosum]|nr:hypothetical protein BHM03_00021979 [Ensete ventricosum]
MKVHETRSHTRSSGEEEGKIGKGKQKAENGGRDSEQQQASKNKKAKVEGENRDGNGEPASDVAAEFEEFCKTTRLHLSINEMRRILEANEQDPSGSEDAVVPRWYQDMMFYGRLEQCPVCHHQMDCSGSNYQCRGAYSEWSTCIYTTTDAPRIDRPVKIPEWIGDETVKESGGGNLKLYGKRGVYKDSMLQEQGGFIFEKDGILYNCAFSLCDQGRGINEYCILQLIQVPEKNVHLYYKKGRVGDDPKADERVEEWNNEDDALKEFVRLFKEVTGNEFETWEREKKFQKMHLKFYPIDMDDGIDVRHGGLSVRQLGVAAAHCKLEPLVANFMKVLCSQEIYR